MLEAVGGDMGGVRVPLLSLLHVAFDDVRENPETSSAEDLSYLRDIPSSKLFPVFVEALLVGVV